MTLDGRATYRRACKPQSTDRPWSVGGLRPIADASSVRGGTRNPLSPKCFGTPIIDIMSLRRNISSPEGFHPWWPGGLPACSCPRFGWLLATGWAASGRQPDVDPSLASAPLAGLRVPCSACAITGHDGVQASCDGNKRGVKLTQVRNDPAPTGGLCVSGRPVRPGRPHRRG